MEDEEKLPSETRSRTAVEHCDHPVEQNETTEQPSTPTTVRPRRGGLDAGSPIPESQELLGSNESDIAEDIDSVDEELVANDREKASSNRRWRKTHAANSPRYLEQPKTVAADRSKIVADKS